MMTLFTEGFRGFCRDSSISVTMMYLRLSILSLFHFLIRTLRNISPSITWRRSRILSSLSKELNLKLFMAQMYVHNSVDKFDGCAHAVSNFKVLFLYFCHNYTPGILTQKICLENEIIYPFASSGVFLQLNCIRPALGSFFFLSILTSCNS